MKEKSPGLLGLFTAGAVLLLSIGLRSVFPRLSTILLVAVCICGIVFVLLLGLVIFFAFWKPKPTDQDAERNRREEHLKRGRAELLSAQMAKNRIRENRIRILGTEACSQMERILKTLREQPEDIPKANLVFSYYLPTLKKILEKFSYLENSNTVDENLKETTVRCLSDIKKAMERQYENLFADDILDLTVEMQTLTQICQRNGLLPENE